MFIKRKDGQCEAKVLARVGDRVLIEAKWPKNNRNIVFVTEAYFAEKYA
jgi:hypothetical protein